MATTAATCITPQETWREQNLSAIWKFMIRFQDKHKGTGPSMKEIAAGCAIRSVPNTHRLLAMLVKRGAVLHRNRRYLALRGKDPAVAKAH
jgi:hypothetical protein